MYGCTFKIIIMKAKTQEHKWNCQDLMFYCGEENRFLLDSMIIDGKYKSMITLHLLDSLLR